MLNLQRGPVADHLHRLHEALQTMKASGQRHPQVGVMGLVRQKKGVEAGQRCPVIEHPHRLRQGTAGDGGPPLDATRSRRLEYHLLQIEQGIKEKE